MTFLDLSENWGHRTIHQYFFEYIDTKVLNKMLANWIQQNSKRIPHQDQVSFIPEVQRWFNTHTQKNYVIYAINKIRKTNKQTWSSQLMQKKHLKKSNTLSWFKKKKRLCLSWHFIHHPCVHVPHLYICAGCGWDFKLPPGATTTTATKHCSDCEGPWGAILVAMGYDHQAREGHTGMQTRGCINLDNSSPLCTWCLG